MRGDRASRSARASANAWRHRRAISAAPVAGAKSLLRGSPSRPSAGFPGRVIAVSASWTWRGWHRNCHRSWPVWLRRHQARSAAARDPAGTTGRPSSPLVLSDQYLDDAAGDLGGNHHPIGLDVGVVGIDRRGSSTTPTEEREHDQQGPANQIQVGLRPVTAFVACSSLFFYLRTGRADVPVEFVERVLDRGEHAHGPAKSSSLISISTSSRTGRRYASS